LQLFGKTLPSSCKTSSAIISSWTNGSLKNGPGLPQSRVRRRRWLARETLDRLFVQSASVEAAVAGVAGIWSRRENRRNFEGPYVVARVADRRASFIASYDSRRAELGPRRLTLLHAAGECFRRSSAFSAAIG
jgi:hypothetical protein